MSECSRCGKINIVVSKDESLCIYCFNDELRPFEIWDGDYIKSFYEVKINEEIIDCWPNAGKMMSVDGSGREWNKEDQILVRWIGTKSHLEKMEKLDEANIL